MHRLWFAPIVQGVDTMFPAVTGVLHATKRRTKHVSVVIIYPNHARVDSSDGSVGFDLIFGVDDRSQTVLRRVGDADCVVESIEGHYGHCGFINEMRRKSLAATYLSCQTSLRLQFACPPEHLRKG